MKWAYIYGDIVSYCKEDYAVSRKWYKESRRNQKNSTLASLSVYCSPILPSGQARTVNDAWMLGKTPMRKVKYNEIWFGSTVTLRHLNLC